MPQEPNLVNYTRAGEVNGMAVHHWDCMGCPFHLEAVGGRKEQNAGQNKANRHQCYNSANDAQAGRKDIYG